MTTEAGSKPVARAQKATKLLQLMPVSSNSGKNEKIWKHHILLLDPRVEDEVLGVRYVGRTNNDPDKRLETHIESARVGGESRKDRWIRELLALGLTPRIKDLGPGDRWERKRLMLEFRAAGARLVNMR